MKNILNYLALFLLITLVTMSCKNKKNNSFEEAKMTKIDIGYSRLRISLPIFVAQEKGFFQKNGIDANLIMYETAQPLMQSLVEGKVEAAGYTALPITFNGMIRSNIDLLFLSTMIEDQKNKISYLLVPEKTNIKTISDLKGKKIGILPTIAYKAWIFEILKKNGLNPDVDVIIQQIAPSQQGQTLLSGGVDALFTNDPAATSVIQNSIAKNLTNDVLCPLHVFNQHGVFPFGSFNISKKWADNNPELVEKIKNSLNEAITYINNNQDEAKDLMKKYLPDQFKGHASFYPNAKYLTSQESSEDIYNAISKKYYEIGIIPKELPLNDLILK